MKGISQIEVPNSRYSAGVGYVVIPQDAEREEFVTRCYRTSTIALYTENTEFILDVLIHPMLLQLVDFPPDGESLGSMVAWVNIPVHNKPLIVSLVSKNDDASGLLEHYFQLQKKTDTGTASIVGRGDKGLIDILVRATEKTTGRINIRVINEQSEGEFNVEVDGDATILVDKSIVLDAGESIELIISDADEEKRTTIVYKRGEGLTYIDEFKNEWKINTNGIFLDSKLVQIGDGGDFAVLFNKLVIEMKKIEAKADASINAIKNGVTVAQDGGSSYKATMTSIISALNPTDATYDNFKSTKLKLD